VKWLRAKATTNGTSMRETVVDHLYSDEHPTMRPV